MSSVAPDIVRSVQGETSQAQAGNCSPAARSVDQREREIAAGAVAADRDVFGAMPCWRRKRHAVERVLMRGRIGMFGREPVIDRERALRAARPASVTIRRWLTIEPEQ